MNGANIHTELPKWANELQVKNKRQKWWNGKVVESVFAFTVTNENETFPGLHLARCMVISKHHKVSCCLSHHHFCWEVQMIKAIKCATNSYSTPQRGKKRNPKPNLKEEINSVVKRWFMLRICGIYQIWTCIKFAAFLDKSAIYLHHMKWEEWPVAPSC